MYQYYMHREKNNLIEFCSISPSVQSNNTLLVHYYFYLFVVSYNFLIIISVVFWYLL